ncbi:hypothetical protein [Haladaptatus sp. R4]|nr:hypothetical protein [Haladaptatus sp. R4]
MIGLSAGAVLEPLFVSNPTGLLAAATALAVALLVGGGLHRSNWRRRSPE